MYFLYASTAMALIVGIGAVTTWREHVKIHLKLSSANRKAHPALWGKKIKRVKSDNPHCAEAPMLCGIAFVLCISSPY